MAAHSRAEEYRSIVEEVELAGELLLPVPSHHLLPRAAGHKRLDEAIEDEEEVDPSIAGLVKHAAVRQPLYNAEARNALGLISSQRRVCLRLANMWIRGVQDLVRQEPSRVGFPAHAVSVCSPPPRLPGISADRLDRAAPRAVTTEDECAADRDQPVCTTANNRTGAN